MIYFQRVYIAFLEINPRKYLAEFRRELEEIILSVYRTIVVLYTIVAGLFGIIKVKVICMKNHTIHNTSASGAEQPGGTLEVPGNIIDKIGVISMKNNPVVHMLCTMYRSIAAFVTELHGNMKNAAKFILKMDELVRRHELKIIAIVVVLMATTTPAEAAIFKSDTGMAKVAVALSTLLASLFIYVYGRNIFTVVIEHYAKGPGENRTEQAENELGLARTVAHDGKRLLFVLLFLIVFLFVCFGISVADPIIAAIFP